MYGDAGASVGALPLADRRGAVRRDHGQLYRPHHARAARADARRRAEMDRERLWQHRHRLPVRLCAGLSAHGLADRPLRSEEHTSELQSLMRTSYAVLCLKKKKSTNITTHR